MATKILKGINFPGLKDTYIIPEAAIELDSTLTETGKAADAAAVGDAINSLDTTIAVDENSDGNIEIRSYLPEQDYLQLDKSLTVDGAAAEGAATGVAISKSSSPYNYLDNSDFRNPVNQRGKTDYTSASYCIDRWVFPNNSSFFSITEGVGVKVTAWSGKEVYFSQRLDLNGAVRTLAGKYVTFAAMSDKGLLLKSMILPTTAGEFSRTTVADNVKMTIGYSSSGQYYWVDIVVAQNKTLTLYWAALYEGEYTAETLPEYKPKGYGVELAECLRYYVQATSARISQAVMFDANGCMDTSVVLPTEMRINPTITIYPHDGGDLGAAGEVQLFVNGGYTRVGASIMNVSKLHFGVRYINSQYPRIPANMYYAYTASADL
jgi:hypothetical protein